MGRFEILKTKQITEALLNLVEPHSENKKLSFSSFEKNEQYKSIMICEVGQNYLIVDGNKYFKSLKKSGVKKVLVYNCGKISREEYLLRRLTLNINQERLSYLNIAKNIKELVDLETKLSTISNRVGIDLQSVERYATLLDFDWDEFNRKQFNEQFNPFEDER